ncbi:MAG: cytochrome b/b6 domain-containing protein [Eggerthellaceae bacterium]|nr:cytochrome b/b6 domain-containing protein [Eggerthellaceae bacterium]
MKSKKITRVALDVVLTSMIVFEMFIQYTGDFLHEVMGFAFFASVATHLLLSAAWMKKTASSARKGTLTGRRTALAIMGILLALTMAILGVSSIAISGLLADAGLVWALGSYAMWKTLHAFSSYALCALVVVHLAMHWAFLASAFKVPYDPSRRQAIGTGVHAVAAVGALALGIMAAREVLPRDIVNSNSNGTETESAYGDTTFQDGSLNDLGNDSSSSDSISEGTSKPRSGKHGPDASPEQTENTTTDNTSSNAIPDANTETITEEFGTASEASTTDVTGTCTLCHKHCPLSAPQCNKPYEAGLI